MGDISLRALLKEYLELNSTDTEEFISLLKELWKDKDQQLIDELLGKEAPSEPIILPTE